MTPRLATFLVFVINGAMIGTWIANIPWIAGQLEATQTEIGVALLATAAGALISMTITGQLLTRISSARMVALSAIVFPTAAVVPVMAPTLGLLVLGLLVFGALNGFLDVSMNAHGVALERAMGRPIMSSLHAGWSLGGLAGAAGVALAAIVGVDPRVEAVVATVVLLAIAAVAIPSLGAGSTGTADGGTRITLPSRAVLPLGVLAVLAAIIEGGIGDWVGLYMERGLGMDAGIAALGFTAFALGLTAGRLAGDAFNARSGAGMLLRTGLAVTAVSLGVVLLVGEPLVALVGVAVCGAGVANAIPLVFGAGGRIKPSGPSLAAVFTMTYTAFLAGPPIIGFIADMVGLSTTLGLLVAAAVVAAIVAPRVPGIGAGRAGGALQGQEDLTLRVGP